METAWFYSSRNRSNIQEGNSPGFQSHPLILTKTWASPLLSTSFLFCELEMQRWCLQLGIVEVPWQGYRGGRLLADLTS